MTDTGLHIILEMARIVRCRNRAGDGGMCHDPFQEKLRPGSTIGFRRPAGQRDSADATKQIASAKGAIHNDGNFPLLRQRKNPLLRLRSMIE